VLLLIGANSGYIFKVVLFDQDQNVQQTISYINNNLDENTVIISPPQFGLLCSPRPWISKYASTLGDQYYLVFTPLSRYAPIYIDGVEKGFVTENNNTYLFSKIATINDVLIYLITLN